MTSPFWNRSVVDCSWFSRLGAMGIVGIPPTDGSKRAPSGGRRSPGDARSRIRIEPVAASIESTVRVTSTALVCDAGGSGVAFVGWVPVRGMAKKTARETPRKTTATTSKTTLDRISPLRLGGRYTFRTPRWGSMMRSLDRGHEPDSADDDRCAPRLGGGRWVLGGATLDIRAAAEPSDDEPLRHDRAARDDATSDDGRWDGDPSSRRPQQANGEPRQAGGSGPNAHHPGLVPEGPLGTAPARRLRPRVPGRAGSLSSSV